MVNGSNVQPPGICHRLLKFLMNNLIGKGIQHITLGSAVSRGSVEIPVETPSRNVRNCLSKTSSKSNSEIVIEFRHIEAKRNGNHVVQDSGRTKIGARKEEQTRPDQDARSPHPKKTDSRFRGNHHKGRPTATPVQENAVRNREKEKDDREQDIVIIHHRTINGNEPAERETIKMPQRPLIRPVLMKAPSNIDEIAETFIQSRKEAISKHYPGYEPNESS